MGIVERAALLSLPYFTLYVHQFTRHLLVYSSR
jgi:hypothetical protein